MVVPRSEGCTPGWALARVGAVLIGGLGCASGSPGTHTCGAAGAPGAVRTLLIGISQYGPQTGFTPVHAAADLATISTALAHLGVAHTCTLRDEDATAEGILTALGGPLLQATQPGDHVLVHYAGHGVAVPDEDGDEADGFDEALAPWGAVRGDAETLLIDDAIAPALDRLRRAAGPEGSVVLVVDACHSGSIARGAAEAAPELTAEALDVGRSGPERAPLVLFAAADDDAAAGETDEGDGPQGRLTTAFASALLASHTPRTWGDVHAEVEVQVALRSASQGVVFAGPSQLGIFGGPNAKTPHWRVSSVEALDRVVLEAGALHGLQPGDGVTDTSGARGTVVSVAPARAVVELEAPGTPAQLAAARFGAAQARPRVSLDPTQWQDTHYRVTIERHSRDAACRVGAMDAQPLQLGSHHGYTLTHHGSAPAWVTVVAEDAQGRRMPLWPRDGQPHTLLQPGQKWTVPVCLRATAPVGTDRVTVLATDLPVSPLGLLGTPRSAPLGPTRGWMDTLEVQVLAEVPPEVIADSRPAPPVAQVQEPSRHASPVLPSAPRTPQVR